MTRMLRPDDILAATSWYCGVDPKAEKVTARVRFAQQVAICAMRQELSMSHDEIGEVFGRTGRSILGTMKHARVLNADIGRVAERARVEADEADRREANQRLAERLQDELRC